MKTKWKSWSAVPNKYRALVIRCFSDADVGFNQAWWDKHGDKLFAAQDLAVAHLRKPKRTAKGRR